MATTTAPTQAFQQLPRASADALFHTSTSHYRDRRSTLQSGHDVRPLELLSPSSVSTNLSSSKFTANMAVLLLHRATRPTAIISTSRHHLSATLPSSSHYVRSWFSFHAFFYQTLLPHWNSVHGCEASEPAAVYIVDRFHGSLTAHQRSHGHRTSHCRGYSPTRVETLSSATAILELLTLGSLLRSESGFRSRSARGLCSSFGVEDEKYASLFPFIRVGFVFTMNKHRPTRRDTQTHRTHRTHTVRHTDTNTHTPHKSNHTTQTHHLIVFSRTNNPLQFNGMRRSSSKSVFHKRQSSHLLLHFLIHVNQSDKSQSCTVFNRI